MAIDVIIPCYGRVSCTESLLEDLACQTLPAHKIIIIDNADDDATQQVIESYPKLPIQYIRNKENIGVNASWNLGISLSKSPLVSIFNNDIVIPPFFLNFIFSAFLRENTGAVIPATASSIEVVRKAIEPPYVKTLPSSRREGWAFTLRRSVIEVVGLIPPELFCFFGDDWFFRGLNCLGFSSFKLVDVPVFHHGGISRRVTKGISIAEKILFQQEEKVWQRLISQ